jgi:hypothetical protein
VLLKIAKLITWVCILAAGVSVFVIGELENKYLGYPKTPDTSVQRTVPWPTKGSVVYISQDERVLLVAFYYAQDIALALAAGIVLMTWGNVIYAKWPWQKDRNEPRSE